LKPRIDKELCLELGIRPDSLGEAEILPGFGDDAGHAFARPALAAPYALLSPILHLVQDKEDLLERHLQRNWRPQHSGVLAAIGVDLRRDQGDHHWVLLAPARDEETFEFKAIGGAEGSVTFDEGVYYVDFSALRGALLTTEEGERFVMKMTNTELAVWPVLEGVLDFGPPVTLDVPLETWLVGLDDAWLEGELRGLLEIGGLWSRVAAAGNYARLRVESPDLVGKLMRGEELPADRVWVWAGTLTEDQRAAIFNSLVAEVELLTPLLENLLGELAPADLGWRECLREVLHRRDRIESVSLLLSRLGWDEQVADLLWGFDLEGEAMMRSIPPVLELSDDPTLLRADQLMHFWWTLPCSWDREGESC